MRQGLGKMEERGIPTRQGLAKGKQSALTALSLSFQCNNLLLSKLSDLKPTICS